MSQLRCLAPDLISLTYSTFQNGPCLNRNYISFQEQDMSYCGENPHHSGSIFMQTLCNWAVLFSLSGGGCLPNFLILLTCSCLPSSNTSVRKSVSFKSFPYTSNCCKVNTGFSKRMSPQRVHIITIFDLSFDLHIQIDAKVTFLMFVHVQNIDRLIFNSVVESCKFPH